jgi:hypothetical protein
MNTLASQPGQVTIRNGVSLIAWFNLAPPALPTSPEKHLNTLDKARLMMFLIRG